jgi:hypothetical protein
LTTDHYTPRLVDPQIEMARFVFFNLRFPGQFADGESGLRYNYHRDYDLGGPHHWPY